MVQQINFNLWCWIVLWIAALGIPKQLLSQNDFQVDTAKINYWNKMGKAKAPSHFDEALKYADSAAIKSKEIAYPEGLGDAITNQGLAYDYNGDFEIATALYDSAASIQLNCGNDKGYAVAINNLGVINYLSGNYDEAVKYYLQAIPYFKSGNYLKGVALALNNIGLIARSRGEYSKALDYYKESLIYKKEIDDKNGTANTLSNIGAIYMILRDLDEASFYTDQAIKIFTDLEKSDEVARLQINKGKILKSFGKYSEAKDNLLQSYNQLKDSKDYPILVQLFSGLGELYLKENKLDSAQTYYEKAYKIIDRQNDIEVTLHVFQELSKITKAKGEFVMSLKYLEEYISTHNEFLDKIQSDEAKEMEAKYSYFNQKEKIESLNRNRIISDLEMSQSKLNQQFLWAALVTGLVVIIYFFYLYRKMKRQKEIAGTALLDKEILLKEIHHRVKNNLQMVSSLLYLQSENIEDDEALQAINVSRTRVEAIAIIHQKLYKEENIIGISTSDYMNDLIDSIFETLQIEESEIEIHKEIDDLSLDIDSTIPIGLILNELISNSLKHAFPEEQKDKRMEVVLIKEAGYLKLKVADNGSGKRNINAKHSTGFGQKLINMFAKKIRAEMFIENTNGYSVELHINKFEER